MKPYRTLLAAVSLLALTGGGVAEAAEKVVTSIKPVHSLVAAVMDGVGEPELILQGAGSPHTYSMRPSQARMLAEADLVFWIGPEMEVFLEKPLESLAGGAKVVTLGETEGLALLDMREGGAFEAHSHGDEGHDHGAHADESQEHHEGAERTEHEGEEHDHDERAEAGHDDHDHHGHDAHIWLDPENAKLMAGAIAEALSEADPDNAATYAANAAALEGKLDALEDEIAGEIVPIKDRPFIVFHDAYQYFEKRFGLAAAGSITVSPEIIPGAQRVDEIHTKVEELGATCVFAEPQFEPRLVEVVTEGTNAKSGVLDPLGAELKDGPELYFDLIRNMAASFKTCLSAGS